MARESYTVWVEEEDMEYAVQESPKDTASELIRFWVENRLWEDDEDDENARQRSNVSGQYSDNTEVLARIRRLEKYVEDKTGESLPPLEAYTDDT